MPLEIRTAEERSFDIPTAEELDQAHAATVESWLPDCFEEIAAVTKDLVHPGEHKVLHSIEDKDNDPCLIERLNSELEDTCFYIKLEEVGNGDYARMRPQIFRLQSTQAEAIAETKRSVRLMSTVVVLVFIAGLSWIVVSNFGLM